MNISLMRKMLVWLVVISFTFVGVTPAFSGSRIIPNGEVKVFKGDELVQVLKQEAPFPKGMRLSTVGKCGVRLQDLYLVANDGCTFGLDGNADRKDLRVEKGLIYFAITEETGQLAFLTPAGDFTTQQVRLNASATGSILKGYLDVGASEAKLGVLEGGSMVVATDGGIQEISTGKQIILALADPIKKDGSKPIASKGADPIEEDDDGIPATYFVGGAAFLGAAGLAIANANRGGGGGPGPASPVNP